MSRTAPRLNRRSLLRGAAGLALGAGAALAQAPAPSFQELEESLTCQCGCGLTVHSCNHLQCPSAIPLRAEIREQMALGASKQDILLHFQTKYGEKILSAPTTSGFNLVAWTTPFLAITIGAAFIGLVVRRWTHQRNAPVETAANPSVASPFSDQIERELRDLDS